MSKSKYRTITVRAEVHKQLKVAAAQFGLSMMEAAEDAVDDWCTGVWADAQAAKSAMKPTEVGTS